MPRQVCRIPTYLNEGDKRLELKCNLYETRPPGIACCGRRVILILHSTRRHLWEEMNRATLHSVYSHTNIPDKCCSSAVCID